MAYALRAALSIAIIAITGGPPSANRSAPGPRLPQVGAGAAREQPDPPCHGTAVLQGRLGSSRGKPRAVASVALGPASCWLLPPGTVRARQGEPCPTPAPRPHQAPAYNWSAETQGIVLSSFFYGYGLTQALGGYGAGLLGGKLVLGSGLLLSSALTLLVPRAAELGAGFLVGLQVLLGLAQVGRGAGRPLVPLPVPLPCTLPVLHCRG